MRALVVSLATVAAIVALRPSEALAQSPRVRFEGCASELRRSVEAAFEIELGAAAPIARERLDDGRADCVVVCEEERMTARVFADGAHAEQRIGADVPGLARRLGVALVELLDASVMLPPPVTASAVTASPSPEDAPPEAPTTAPSGLRVRLRSSVGVLLTGEPLFILGAVELGAELVPHPNVAIVIAAAGAIGALDVPAGFLDVRLASAAASLRCGGAVGSVWLGGGVASRGGAVIWTGSPGRDAAGGWLGLGAVVAARLALGHWNLGLELEGGGIAIYSGARVTGTDVDVARVGGGWFEPRFVVDLLLP